MFLNFLGVLGSLDTFNLEIKLIQEPIISSFLDKIKHENIVCKIIISFYKIFSMNELI